MRVKNNSVHLAPPFSTQVEARSHECERCMHECVRHDTLLCLSSPKSPPPAELVADVLGQRDRFERALLSHRKAVGPRAAARRRQKRVNIALLCRAKAHDLPAGIDCCSKQQKQARLAGNQIVEAAHHAVVDQVRTWSRCDSRPFATVICSPSSHSVSSRLSLFPWLRARKSGGSCPCRTLPHDSDSPTK
jgi:hypothetical protein